MSTFTHDKSLICHYLVKTFSDLVDFIFSMSLHLGEEIFDIHTMPIQGDFNHLFIRQGTGLQGQSIFKTKLSFRYA